MKNYLVMIKVMDPFEKKWDLTETAATAELAIKRAVAKWRKENWARRPLNEVWVHAKKL